MKACVLLLAFCLPSVALGFLSTEQAPVNQDRLTCLRQDDLDLVKPMKPQFAFRMIQPLSDEDSDSDAVVSMEQIWIKHVSMEFTFRRKEGNTFAFTFGAPVDKKETQAPKEGAEEEKKPAILDFRVGGIDLLLKNWWHNKGASAATNRGRMKKGQDGELRLRLHGEGKVIWNPTTASWEVKLVKKESQPFSLHFEGQWFLRKVVAMYTKAKKVDEQLIDAIWLLIERSMPDSVSAALNYLDKEDFSASARVTLEGAQETADTPLVLRVDSRIEFDTSPVEMLSTLYEKCDPAAVAKTRMQHFFQTYGDHLLEMWQNSREVLVSALAKYGVKIEVLDKPLDKAGLEEVLLKAATAGADFVLQALQPFTEATARGERGLFQDLFARFQVLAGWDRAKNDSRVEMYLQSIPRRIGTRRRDRTEVLKLPAKFLSLHLPEAVSVVLPPLERAPVTRLSHRGVSYTHGKLVCKELTAAGLRIRAKGNEKQRDRVWKVGGTTDFEVALPPIFDFGVGMKWDAATVRHLHDGSFALDLLTPLRVVQEVPNPLEGEKLMGELYRPRRGSYASLDGAVPSSLARPPKKQAESRVPKLVQSANTTTSVYLTGKKNRLKLVLNLHGTFTMKAEELLAPFLTSQSTTDFGYVFYTGLFRRLLEGGEDAVAKDSTVVVVLSCGFLRLLSWDAPATKDPWRAVDFDPDHGQLQLDVAQYLAPPEHVSDKQGRECLDLYSNYGPGPREVTNMIVFKSKANEKLCSGAEEVQNLRNAISWQLERFQSDLSKTVAWNYGTHDEGREPLYQLEPGLQARGLDEVIADLSEADLWSGLLPTEDLHNKPH